MEPKYLDRVVSVATGVQGRRGCGEGQAGFFADGMAGGKRDVPATLSMSGRLSRTGRVAQLFVMLLLLPGAGQADIYAFVDEVGITHFSNVPQDRRYRPFLRTTESSASLRAPADRRIPQQFAQHVSLFGSASQVSPALIHAVISAESGYNPNARSRKGAMGLMQLMPGTAQRYQVSDPYDPAQNIRGGVSYLRDLMRQFDADLPLVLAAYNAGEGAVQRHGNRIPPFAETRQYVPRVLELYERYLRDSPGMPVAAFADRPSVSNQRGGGLP